MALIRLSAPSPMASHGRRHMLGHLHSIRALHLRSQRLRPCPGLTRVWEKVADRPDEGLYPHAHLLTLIPIGVYSPHSIPLGVLLMTVSLDGIGGQACGCWTTYPAFPGAGGEIRGHYLTLAPFGQLGQAKARAEMFSDPRRNPAGTGAALRLPPAPQKAGTTPRRAAPAPPNPKPGLPRFRALRTLL